MRGWARPHQSIALEQRKEGCDGTHIQSIVSVCCDAHGAFTLNIPDDALPTYNGLLFRIIWQVSNGESDCRLSVHPDKKAIIDPYHAIGLHANPFVAETLDPRTALPAVPERLWLDRGYSTAPASKQTLLVQLIGHKGAGKSSHLKHWHQQRPGPLRYFPRPYFSRWRVPPVADICYWDEACRIPLPLLCFALWRAKKQRATICVGTHRDLSPWAKRFGLAVRTHSLNVFSIKTLQQWAQMRIDHACIDTANPAPLTLPDSTAKNVWQHSAGSWRHAMALLHRWAADYAANQQSLHNSESSSKPPQN